MKKLIILSMTAVLALLSFSSCQDAHATFNYIALVETSDGAVEYEVEYVAYLDVNNKMGKESFSSSDSRFYKEVSVGVTFIDSDKVLDAVPFTLRRKSGDGVCTMYLIDQKNMPSDSPFLNYEAERKTELTDSVMQWVRTNYMLSCTLQPEQDEVSILVRVSI